MHACLHDCLPQRMQCDIGYIIEKTSNYQRLIIVLSLNYHWIIIGLSHWIIIEISLNYHWFITGLTRTHWDSMDSLESLESLKNTAGPNGDGGTSSGKHWSSVLSSKNHWILIDLSPDSLGLTGLTGLTGITGLIEKKPGAQTGTVGPAAVNIDKCRGPKRGRWDQQR